MRSTLRTLAATAALALVTGTAGAQITATFYTTPVTPDLFAQPTKPTLGSALSNVFCTTTVPGLSFTHQSPAPVGATTWTTVWANAGCAAPADRPSMTSFGARFTGTFIAPSAGTYRFNYTTDDGALFFINGAMVRDDWMGQNASSEFFDVSLVAGENRFQFDYYANSLTPSVFRVDLPTGVGVVPEPSTYALMATGLAGLGALARRRRRA
jgi:hypothetical protein